MINFSIQPFFIPTLLLILANIPLVFNWVPPNNFYGVRTAIARTGKAAWYRANSWFGKMGLCSGAVYLVIMFAIPYNEDPLILLVHIIAFVGPWAFTLILGKRSKTI